MDLTEIAPHVYRLGVPMSGVFLLLDERVTLIDTGPRWSRKRILEALGDLGRDASELAQIVLTHAHPDHYGSLAAFDGHTAQRLAHGADAEVVRGERHPELPGPRFATTLYRWLGARFFEPDTHIDVDLDDRDLLPVLGGLRVVHTPGHTAGHVALLLEEQGVLFSGDALQVSRRRGLIPPIVGGNRDEATRSLAVMAELDFEVLAPSHFPAVRDGARARLRELAATALAQQSGA